MSLFNANHIFNDIDRFVSIINTTIGVLQANREILMEDTILISLKSQKDNEVGIFLLEEITKNALLIDDCPFEFHCLDNEIQIEYQLTNSLMFQNTQVLGMLSDLVYQAVDAAKVEYCLIIEPMEKVEIPYDILCELDQWNEDQEYYEEDYEPIDYTDLKQYRMNKNCLYGISLGYYDINVDLVESDLVPELIGVLFEAIKNFCYVISDKDYIYFYSVVPFNDDIEFDITEGLINCLGLLSETKQEETLEEFWDEMRKF